MEIKKTPKADLQNKRGLLLEIGLIVAIGLMIAAFAVSQPEQKIQEIDMKIASVEEDIVEITRQDQKPPEPVKQTITVVSDIINVVTNDRKITTDVTFADFGETDIVVPVIAKKEEQHDSDEPFIVAEVMPSFQGGDLSTFRTWVQKQLKYPSIASENGISGKVIISFVIEKDGSLTNITVLQTPDRSLSEEAIRVLQTSPKWTPGKQRSAPVRVKYNLPVEFKIQN